jgi:hypothetical protein
MKYKYELKFKKRFPFIYIHKRFETITERIFRQYNEVVNILPIVILIDGLILIKNKLK